MLIEYVGAVIGIFSISLISLFPKLITPGLVMNMAASSCFWINALLCKQWGVLISQSFYFIISLAGIISRLKET